MFLWGHFKKLHTHIYTHYDDTMLDSFRLIIQSEFSYEKSSRWLLGSVARHFSELFQVVARQLLVGCYGVLSDDAPRVLLRTCLH